MTQALARQENSPSTPRWVGANAEKVLAARGNRDRLKRIFDSSLVPMVLVDGNRRYVEVNVPARLAFRVPLAELRLMRIDNLTPDYLIGTMKAAWARLIATGCVAGPYSVASPDGTSLDIVYYALADALPGLHLIMFSPAQWPEDELLDEFQLLAAEGLAPLSARELQVLQLAADGQSAPMIAKELGLSVATVRTHLGHVYDKLGVGDRAGAVAKALRVGMIS